MESESHYIPVPLSEMEQPHFGESNFIHLYLLFKVRRVQPRVLSVTVLNTKRSREVEKYTWLNIVSAIFFMRIHPASTRVRRIHLVYPEISVYALQSGNFCICCVFGYVWTLVSVYFCIR